MRFRSHTEKYDFFQADPEYQELEGKDDLDSIIDERHNANDFIIDKEDEELNANARFCREESLGN